MAVRDLLIGEVPGQPVGTRYATRREAMEKHVHTQSGRGIDARAGEPGAGAICPSGGYIDDVDHGDWILYTGQGGRDMTTGRQTANQSLGAKDNAALVSSHDRKWPVRVLRGNGADIYAPSSGYRYDGLYWVDDYWTEPGRDGFLVCRFLMVQLTAQEALPWVSMADYPGQALPTVMDWNRSTADHRQPPEGRGSLVQRLVRPVTTRRQDLPTPSPAGLPDGDAAGDHPPTPPATSATGTMPEGNDAPGVTVSLVYRKQRDTRVTRALKALYDNRCQVCGARIELATGPYSEGAHIRPIGEPHNGPDRVGNMLCLCPNHHTMFDGGGLYIASNYFVYERDGSPVGPLAVDVGRHLLDPAHLGYHRRLHGFE